MASHEAQTHGAPGRLHPQAALLHRRIRPGEGGLSHRLPHLEHPHNGMGPGASCAEPAERLDYGASALA